MLSYHYDKEADVFYFSEGTPRSGDKIVETNDDVVLRINPRTKEVRGFTLLNASRRSVGTSNTTKLPFSLVPSTD